MTFASKDPVPRPPLAAASMLAVLIPASVLLSGTALASPAAASTAAARCSVPRLVSAISAANRAGGTVTLATRCTYRLTAPNNATDGGTGLPVITNTVKIRGSGTSITRSGAAVFRLFDVAAGGSLSLSGLTLSNGLANDGANGGGAVDNHGTLTVTGVTFTANQSPAPTGASGGAVSNSGTLTVGGSVFRGNTAQEGGAVLNQNNATITNTWFSGNTATSFGGGAIVNVLGTTTLRHDAFTGNKGPGGGAIDNDAVVNADDSLFTGNVAGANGGGALQNFGTMTVTRSLVSGNTSPFGADLYNFTGASLTVTMSIIADGIGGSNCGGGSPVTDGGHNFDSGTSCGFSASSQSVSRPLRPGPSHRLIARARPVRAATALRDEDHAHRVERGDRDRAERAGLQVDGAQGVGGVPGAGAGGRGAVRIARGHRGVHRPRRE